MKLSGIVLVLVSQFTLAMASASPSPSVIVIGAGVSGILAAKTLHDAGVQDFLILEADNRIGGRLHRTLFAGHTVELGANWIPGGGPKSSPFYEIASQIKLKSYLSDYDNISSNTYKQEGGLYPKQVVPAALETAEKREDFCTNLSILLFSNRGNVGDDISILASQRLSGKVPTTPLEKVIDYYYMDYEDAEPPRNTGLKNTLPRHEFIDFGEDQYFVSDPRGFESMVNQVAQQFLSKKDHVIIDPRLKLNKVVREINYSVSGVQVKAEDGSVYQTKYAIVSVSVGVLQSNLIQFHPQLPLWKTLALNYFDMAIYTKIFLKFPYKFWPSGPGTEFFLYAHEIRGYYAICQHLENEMPGSNILFVTVTDDESRRVEQQKDDALQAEAMDVLRKMFGNKIPNPEAILVPRWWSNRFFKGSFSNWPAGYTWRRYQQLRAPVGPIYFTGEYANATYLAYAEAAYFAGIRTADNVIKRLKTAKRKGHGISD